VWFTVLFIACESGNKKGGEADCSLHHTVSDYCIPLHVNLRPDLLGMRWKERAWNRVCFWTIQFPLSVSVSPLMIHSISPASVCQSTNAPLNFSCQSTNAPLNFPLSVSVSPLMLHSIFPVSVCQSINAPLNFSCQCLSVH
jgi:hypothetical protein